MSDTTLTKQERSKLQKLRSDLIIRQTWKDKTYKLISEIQFKTDIEELPEKTESKTQVERSYLWHFISSGWIFLFVMIIMPFVGLADKNTSIGTAVGILIVIEPLFFGLAWLFAKAFSFIPVLFGNPIFNYILNVILSFIILFVLTKVSGNKKKKTTGNTI